LEPKERDTKNKQKGIIRGFIKPPGALLERALPFRDHKWDKAQSEGTQPKRANI